MSRINLIFSLKKYNVLEIILKKDGTLFAKTDLTISQGFDKLLIVSVDKLLAKSNIDRSSLKSITGKGKPNKQAVSGMVLETIRTAFEI